jgi:hypothetical protein
VQQRDPAEARRIVQHPHSAVLADREHPARGTGRLQLTRLHLQHHPPLVVDIHSSLATQDEQLVLVILA